MPEGYTHVRTAHRAAKGVHYRIQYPAAFAAGANGPDSLFCFEVWKSAAKRRYDLPGLGNRMHEENTGAFLQSLVKRVSTRPQVEYALGFLAHYGTDTVMHPYVCALCQPGMPYAGPGGHGYFEIALDSTLHAEDTGSATVPAEDTSPRMHGEELADVTTLLAHCLSDAYGLDIPIEYLADAFEDIYRLRSIFPSRYGVKKALFTLVEPMFGGRGFITGHVSPRHLVKDLPDQWTDPFTGEQRRGNAFALLREAEKRSGIFMAGALEYWMRGITGEEFFGLLGSMSYTEGRPTPQSDPALAARLQAEEAARRAAEAAESQPEPASQPAPAPDAAQPAQTEQPDSPAETAREARESEQTDWHPGQDSPQ